jgi:hypothetical protein
MRAIGGLRFDEGMGMKSVNIVCDLCGTKAEREIEINSRKVAVCGPICYSRFWAREYEDWRAGQYFLKVQFGNTELATEIEKKLDFVIKRTTGT